MAAQLTPSSASSTGGTTNQTATGVTHKANPANPNAAQAQQPAAQTQQPAAPTQDPTHALFKDPNAFKAEWDKFVAANQNYKLIADPKLLSVLKTMWMRSGGMKAESKKNKGKRV
jgi:hypothetical protein